MDLQMVNWTFQMAPPHVAKTHNGSAHSDAPRIRWKWPMAHSGGVGL